MFASTPRTIKRKSMMDVTTPLNLSVALIPLRGSPSAALTSEKNDEEERRARKQSIFRASIVQNSESAPLNRSFVNKQYDRCKILFMENKITIKNAWELPIIDMLQEICNPSRPDFLREASISIDIGSRVYSLRVDYVHAEGMKLAKNMARVTANFAEDDEEQADQEVEGNNGSNKKKRKMKRRIANGIKSTIVADPKMLLSSFSKLEPVDFTLRGDSELGQISGLFTRKLHEDNTTFVTLNKEKLLFPDVEPPIENIPVRNIHILHNCPIKLLGRLVDFGLDNYQLGSTSMNLFPSQQPLVFDEDGTPLHENDGPVGDNVFDDDNNVSDDAEMEIAKPEYITNFYNNFANSISEYTFKPLILSNSGQIIEKLWAGPSHWKLKGIKRLMSQFTGTVATRNQRLKRGRKSELDFIENFTMNFDETHPEKSGLKSKTVKKRKGIDENKIMLPLPDLGLHWIENYDTLHLKPGVTVSRLRKEPQQLSDDCDNHDDNGEGDCLENNDFSNGHGEMEVMGQSQGYDAEDLVDVPTMVPIFALNFARKSNYTNVKKLKDMIWTELSGHDMDSPQTEPSDLQPTSFSNVYRMVTEKEPKKSPSPHITFMAILHLANEKGLQLDAESDFKNFMIKPLPSDSFNA